jgi:hypothetical protein
MRYEIQEDIIIMSFSKFEDDYQEALKAEEKLSRKQIQQNRGENSSKGKGTNREKFQKPKHEARKKHSHLEKGGSSKEGKHGGRSFPRGRVRARGGKIKCYACGKTWHMYWECPEKKKDTIGGEEHISEAHKYVEEEAAEGGRNLMMREVLLKPDKEVEELVQRTSLFITAFKMKDRVCKVIIDSGRIDNLVSIEMVEKL